MKAFSNWLATNPAIVIATFVVGIVSGIATLLTSWEQLYTEYLSKSIQIPGWLALVFLLLLPFLIYSLRGKAEKEKDPVGWEVIEGKEFGVQALVVDGRSFVRCKFVGTQFVFSGERAFGFDSCHLERITITLTGGAERTLTMLTEMYRDEGFREYVEGTIDNIRAGTVPQVPRPNPI